MTQPLFSARGISRAVAGAARRWYAMKQPPLSVGGMSLLLLLAGAVLAWNNDTRPPTASLFGGAVGLLGLTVAEYLWRLSRRLSELEKQSGLADRDRAGPA